MTNDDLYAWRIRLGLTQHEAAKALGISLGWYQSLERGKDLVSGQPTRISRRLTLACIALEHGED